MESNQLAGGMRDMSNIIKYEGKIIANVEYELRELLDHIDTFSINEIALILRDTLDLLRDNKQ